MAQPRAELTEKDLHHWQMLAVFQEVLEEVCARVPLHGTFADPRRTLGCAPYLSLFLFGLCNPVVQSMRGLCSLSRLPRVRQATGCAQVSLGSFSEAQAVIEPRLLEEVFKELFQRTQSRSDPERRLAPLNVVLQDGSLWRALPRMAWAEYGVGPKGDAKGVRLHLRFHLVSDKPLAAKVTQGRSSERQALRELCVAGQTNVGDRLYGEDYQLFGEIDLAQGFFVFRLKEDAVLNVEEELPLSAADRAAGVVRQVWARLGAQAARRSIRVRVVEIQTADQHLLLVTNLPVETAAADLIGLIYRRRWTIELFFRWIKCILGCRHFFAESLEGVAIQLYLALIAALLFQGFTGRRPTQRQMELIQCYFLGWASAEDLLRLLPVQGANASSQKN